MNYFIVYAHPERKSYNGSALDAALSGLKDEGHSVTISDLYNMEFDPRGDQRDFLQLSDEAYFKYQLEQRHATEHKLFRGDVVAEQEKLLWCDFLILQFPLWWFSLPAILKGWVDRVFAMGFSYGGGMWYDKGRFRGKRAMLAYTTGGPQHMYTGRGLNGDIDAILYHIQHGMLYFTGFDVVPAYAVWSVARISDEERRQAIDGYVEKLLNLENEPIIKYPKLDDYDEKFLLKK